MKGLDESLIERFRDIVGSQHVASDGDEIGSLQRATFPTDQQIKAVLYPATVQEVSQCLLLASGSQVPVYSVSRGNNWGYGSKVPYDHAVLMHLNRMDAILDFDDELGCVTIEPGVSFHQLANFLQDQTSDYILSAPGSTSDASVMGNTLERGISQGGYTQRSNQVGNLQVVMADGTIVETGAGGVTSAVAKYNHKYGLGPHLDGLFFQSGLGVVTRMTLWLKKRPDFFRTFHFSLKDSTQFGPLFTVMRTFKQQQVVPVTFSLFNDYRIMTFLGGYPYHQLPDGQSNPTALKQLMQQYLAGRRWFGQGAIESFNQQVLDHTQAYVNDELSTLVSLEWTEPDQPNPYYSNSTASGLSSAYWRKRALPESGNLDPDRDDCGLLFINAVLPFKLSLVWTCTSRFEEQIIAHGFEPAISLQCIDERTVYFIGTIHYDRSEPGEDRRAMDCFESVQQDMYRRGYFPYRGGLQTLPMGKYLDQGYQSLLDKLRAALDPHQVMAPGKLDKLQDE